MTRTGVITKVERGRFEWCDASGTEFEMTAETQGVRRGMIVQITDESYLGGLITACTWEIVGKAN